MPVLRPSLTPPPTGPSRKRMGEKQATSLETRTSSLLGRVRMMTGRYISTDIAILPWKRLLTPCPFLA
ncbi:hypothetical protein B0T26DRAFT_388016 [Lasiosphaeria miniovina]|uniref:Uncharacterized protein n=1 Tax=Lasiosphaeria miniovina TaxID=1954250 RepID=A0AA40A488_9PEZI|nr:uncharacterized protein B0T26DRAFT_388016 [Lasiosphaeria miniovina]KAK0708957.1 hypothetical protein B0T26DRAFT_388016 [Lasiosphaeria miniovina]